MASTLVNAFYRMDFAHLLNPSFVREKVREWLTEDIRSFDCGGFVVGDNVETAVLLCKSPGVLAGRFIPVTVTS